MLGIFCTMKVSIITKIIADIDVSLDDVVNSDTVGEYQTQLHCDVGNSALHYLSTFLPPSTDIEIISTKPSEEGIEEYENLLNNWEPEYRKRMNKYEK